VTGNPVGTDTWGAGLTCPCTPCQDYVAGIPTSPAQAPETGDGTETLAERYERRWLSAVDDIVERDARIRELEGRTAYLEEELDGACGTAKERRDEAYLANKAIADIRERVGKAVALLSAADANHNPAGYGTGLQDAARAALALLTDPSPTVSINEKVHGGGTDTTAPAPDMSGAVPDNPPNTSQLEALLNSEGDAEIWIRPDGSIVERDKEVEAVGWAILQSLHRDVPEPLRPQSWSDMSGDHEQRIRTAAVAAIECLRGLDAKGRQGDGL
jgi:hypothetical protein